MINCIEGNGLVLSGRDWRPPMCSIMIDTALAQLPKHAVLVHTALDGYTSQSAAG